MTKAEFPQPIPDNLPEDLGDLWWDERTKISMMADKHIENAINKLMGLGKTKYDMPDELRRRWVSILSMVRAQRLRESRATKVN